MPPVLGLPKFNDGASGRIEHGSSPPVPLAVVGALPAASPAESMPQKVLAPTVPLDSMGGILAMLVCVPARREVNGCIIWLALSFDPMNCPLALMPHPAPLLYE